jgi:hypothetical protein
MQPAGLPDRRFGLLNKTDRPNMTISARSRPVLLTPVFFILSLLGACSRTAPPAKSAAPGDGEAVSERTVPAGADSAYGLNPQAILEPGGAPLWFELGPGGPLHIDAPGAAALLPFEPWPRARYVAGFLFREDTLFLAINQDGFLIFTPRHALGGTEGREGLFLYRAADPLLWKQYTIGSFFWYRDFPAVLLYRDDLFSEPAAEAPMPRVRGMVPGIPAPVGLEVPALAPFPPEAGWDIDTLRSGADGFWYYRSVLKPSASAPVIRYLRSADLSLPGEETSLAAFQKSARLESPAGAPPLLRLVLEEAFELSGPERSPRAAVLFPGLSGPRFFTSPLRPGNGDFIELAGYYRDTGTFPEALVLRGDGRGIYGRDRGAGFEIRTLTLPPLQEGFIYTGAAPIGAALIISWEEQEGWNIGSAGFMAVNREEFLSSEAGKNVKRN